MKRTLVLCLFVLVSCTLDWPPEQGEKQPPDSNDPPASTNTAGPGQSNPEDGTSQTTNASVRSNSGATSGADLPPAGVVPCDALFAARSGGIGDADPGQVTEAPTIPFSGEERVADGFPAGQAESRGIVGVSKVRSGGLLGETVLGASCTGALIGERWVLTAAHCGFSRDAAGRETAGYGRGAAYVGSLAKGGGSVVKGTFYCHKDYGLSDGGHVNDLALIRLDSPVTSEPPVRLVLADDAPMNSRAGGVTLIPFGFGYVSHNGTAPVGTSVLMTGRMSLLTNPTKCASRTSLKQVTFCSLTTGTGDKPSSLCGGDSGGPLFADPDGRGARMFGVNSFITNAAGGEPICGRSGNYSGFVDVAKYRGWLQTATGLPL